MSWLVIVLLVGAVIYQQTLLQRAAGRTRRAPGVATPPGAPPATAPPAEAPPPAAGPEPRIASLISVLEDRATETSHPRELLGFAEFTELVGILASADSPSQLVRQYAAGRRFTPACAAFEALRQRPDRQEMFDFAWAQIRTFPPGTLHFVLRYFASLEVRPPVGDPATIAEEWWSGHSMLIESFRDHFSERAALGDAADFGPGLAAAGVEPDSLRAFLQNIDHPTAPRLLDALAGWRARRVDEAALQAIGRFWTSDPSDIFVEPAPWKRALDGAEAAILGDRQRSILVSGAPRVGKSTFLRLLGLRLAAKGWRVFEATAADLMADQIYIGQLEGRIRTLVAELDARKKVVWFAGDLEQMALSGTHKGQSASVLDQIQAALMSGRLLIFAEASPESATRVVQTHPSLRVQLELARLAPFSEPELRGFASQIGEALQRTRAVTAPAATLDAAVHYGQQYLHGQEAPGIVADILKRAASDAGGAPGVQAGAALTRTDIVTAVSQMTGLPPDMLAEDRPIELSSIRAFFQARVMGQPHAVDVVVDRIAMLKAGLTDPSRPIGIFLFAGPTGTGKTELAKTLADFLFGSPDRLLRLDMSEYQSPDTLSKIIGEPGRQRAVASLVDRIREEPFSVLLLDEFEKAHPKVWDLFLQVFDDARLTDANGQTADFRHAIIILTSNLGATSHQSAGVGFNPSRTDFSEDQVLRAVREAFRPEFVNRLDRVVVFRPLTRDLIHTILRKELAGVLRRRGLKSREWAVEWEESALDFLVERGFSPELGARPLKRAIDHYLLAPLAATLVEQRFPEGDQFLFVRASKDALEVEFVDPDEDKDGDRDGDALKAPANPGVTLSQLILHPHAEAGALQTLRTRRAQIEDRLDAADWRARKSKAYAAAADPDIWSREDRVQVFSAVNLIERVADAADAARKMEARLLSVPGGVLEGREADIAGLALQLRLVEAGICDAETGAPADAILMVEPSGAEAGKDLLSRAWAESLFAMYLKWARLRGMEITVSRPAKAGPAILKVSGFGAWRTLQGEAGLHVREGSEDDGAKRITARVRACEAPHATGRQPGHRTMDATLRATPASRTIVRRYRAAPSPLVRDQRTGDRSGNFEQVMDGNFDVIFG